MATTDASPSQLLLKIESFSLLSKHGIRQYKSREFATGDYTWGLIIYLNEDDISADLAMVGTGSLPMDWELEEFSHSSVVETWTGKVRRFNAIKSKWGISKFISNKSLTDPSNGFLVDDICVFGAEVFVTKRQRVIECVSVLNPIIPYERDWKISNFSKLNQVWTSEEFTAGDHKWVIDLYPNGLNDEQGRSISIFLRSLDSERFGPHEKLKAHFCLRIKSQLHGQHHSRCTTTWFESSRTDWGWCAFLSIADMHDSSKGFTIKDCCLLETEISVQVVAQDAA